MPAYFIKYSDETGPKTHEFSSGELILGRAPDCQVVLKDFGISRQHAKLIADPGGVRIMDLGSKNGTKINGNLVTQSPLREGDKFSLGSLEILFGKTAEAKVAFDDEPIEASGTIVRSVGDLSKLLAVGLTFGFALQTFIIVGGVVRLIPLTGITLPFVSYGGSSIVANFVLLAGLLLVSNRANERLGA